MPEYITEYIKITNNKILSELLIFFACSTI